LIVARAPFRTGAYARSWVILSQTATSITVGSTADPRLFVMLEFTGAVPHKIDSAFKIGDQWFYIKTHPGFKARPHVRPAMKQLESMTLGIVYSLMDVHFPKLMRGEGRRTAQRLGFRGIGRPRAGPHSQLRSNVGRTTVDTTANIGRGTKGSITAQLTSRRTFRKRIRVRGTRRVGTSSSTSGRR
jgi:hypothetical protein